MKLQYDAQVGAAYLTLADSPVADSEEVKPGIVIDYDAKGRIVGIEVLNVLKQSPDADPKRIQLEVAGVNDADDVIEEARQAGQAYIDSFKGDRQAMLADLRRRQDECVKRGGRVVSLPPKPPRAHQSIRLPERL